MKVVMSTQPPIVSSAVKVLAALELLCRAGRPLSLESIARDLGVTQPTGYRIVNTLIATGYVKPQGVRQGYVATVKVMGLGSHMSGSWDLRDAARKVFRPIGMKFGETITVARLDGFQSVFVDKIRAGSSLVFFCDIGRSLPLHLGAAGRSMLAHLSDEEFESYLTSDLASRTSASLVDPAVLRTVRDQTREEGYAVSIDEVDLGVSAIAVPILDPSGHPLGAAAIANTSSAWSPEDRAARAQAMLAASQSIFNDIPTSDPDKAIR